MVTHLYGILGVILDRTFGNIIRMVRVIRLPKEERGHLSWTFVGTLAVILAYGLIMMFSASYSSGYTNHDGNIYYFIRPQAIVACVGFVVMLAVSLVNYRALRYMFCTFYVITLALLVLALFMPSDNNGCYRWVYLPGGMSLQPSELAKFAVILGTADILDRHQREIKSLFHCVIKPACLLFPILVLLRLEPHNSAMLLMAMIFASLLVCAGAGGLKLWGVVVPAALVGGWYFIQSLATGDGYAADRLGGVWGLTPTDTAGMLWQTRQSIYAISTGGLFGVGIGNSVQKHQWLPYAENDFIFSVVCEELGFIGALALIVLFGALIVQGIFIALAPDFFGTLLGIGIMAQVAWQAFCHIGVATALLPNTGISLPFFSYGGTSLLILLGEMGIMLSISRAGNGRREARRQREQEELERRLHRKAYRRREV